MGELLVLALLAWGAATLGARWLRASRTTLIAVLWVLSLIVFAAPLPVLATAILFLAAIALGDLVLQQAPAALKGLLGLLLLTGTLGWLLPLPVHHGHVYLVLCAALICVRWRALRNCLQTEGRRWTEAVVASPGLASFCVIVVGLAATACWLPTMQFDDLAYHLRLPWNLQEQGFYSPAPQYQVWALAPWLADVVHAVAQLMSGVEARGPVNALWLFMLAAGVWRLSTCLGGTIEARWLSVAVAASLPLTAALAGGMQAELPIAAALSWLLAVVAGPRDGSFRFWLALSILVGGLAAMKVTSGAMACLVLLWALIRHPWPSPSRIIAIIAVALVVGGSSYVYAQLIAGNPVLPLFNSWFQSAYFPSTNFVDERWRTGLTPLLFWSMSFDTDHYLEAYDGGGGFLLVALAGAWLLAFLRKETRAAAVVATGTLLLPLIPLQYLRYAYPGFVLLSAVLVTTGFRVGASRFSWLLIGLCVLNLGFQANSHWILRQGGVKQGIKAMGQDAPLMQRYAPERALAGKIRDSGRPPGNVLVIDPEQPFFAEFGDRGRTTSWYSPSLSRAATMAAQDASGQAWIALLRRERIHDVILRSKTATPAQRQALHSIGAVHEATVAETEWWSLQR